MSCQIILAIILLISLQITNLPPTENLASQLKSVTQVMVVILVVLSFTIRVESCKKATVSEDVGSILIVGLVLSRLSIITYQLSIQSIHHPMMNLKSKGRIQVNKTLVKLIP